MLSRLALARIPEGDDEFRANVRNFIRAHCSKVPPELRIRSWMGFDAEFSRKLAGRGWIGLTLPIRYGGAGRSAFARFVLAEELLNFGAPVAAHWIADRQSGPLILRFGTEMQRAFYLPKICRGEAFFCIGMSEPDVGSDLASVRARAARVSDGWSLSGTKLWSTHANRCHYMIALMRTSGTPEDRQKGLSQFVIDLRTPGVHVRAIRDLTGDEHFAEVTFDGAVIPEDALIGTEGGGWSQVNAELAFERSGPERFLSNAVLLDEWIKWLRNRDLAPSSVSALGRLAARLSVIRALSVSLTAQLVRGESPTLEAALVKDIGTTFEQEVPDVVANLLGSEPGTYVEASLAETLAFASMIAPSYSLRGGTREILRGMIARALGLR